MLKILKLAKQAKDDGYNFIGINFKNEPEKIKALVEFTEKNNLFCGYGMNKDSILEYKYIERYIGLDLRDMKDQTNFTKLIWRSGNPTGGSSTIKVVSFNELINMGFWL